jgi:hypothetical protein
MAYASHGAQMLRDAGERGVRANWHEIDGDCEMRRRYFQLKCWPILFAVLFIGGGALAVLATHSRGSAPPL